MMVEKKLGDVVNRLNKTKREAHPDLRAEREERDRQERIEQKSAKEEEVGYTLLCLLSRSKINM